MSGLAAIGQVTYSVDYAALYAPGGVREGSDEITEDFFFYESHVQFGETTQFFRGTQNIALAATPQAYVAATITGDEGQVRFWNPRNFYQNQDY